MQYTKIIIFLLSFISLGANAQSQFEDYTWEKTPSLHEIQKDLQEEGELLLMDKHIIEYAYDKEGLLKEYELEHSITWVNSDEAIEQNNRIYLPLKERAEIIKQQARVINSAGKVITLDEDDIQEAEEEDGRKFRYFALKGLEKGSEVEYLVHTKKPINVEGRGVILQGGTPKQNVSFEILSPANLIFAYKGLNGFGEMEQDTTDEEIFHLKKMIDFIPAAKREGQAVFRPNLMQVMYKIDENTDKRAKNLISYSEIAQNFMSFMTQETDKKTNKAIEKMMKDLDLAEMKDQEKMLRKLEHHLKTNYSLLEGYIPELEDLANIMEYQQASERGIVRLYINILEKLDTDYQLVITSDREEIKFDEEFEAYPYLSNYMLYFPEIDKYLPPTTPLFCLGLIPPYWGENNGLFITPITLGGFTSGTAEIKYIEPLDHNASKDNMLLKAKVDGRLPSIKVEMEKEVFGYYAQGFQPIYHFIDDETKKEVDKAQVQWINEDMDIGEIEVLNTDYKDFGVKPLVVKSDFTSKAFIESAGNKFIFKIGELIGPQMEMYQEEERKFPVEQSFNRFYHRIIEFEVPKGYKVSNLDALKFDITYKEEGEKIMAFESDYTLEGNLLRVVCDEYYTQNILPVELFEEYRKVINAAADFNKVVLYLTKN